MVAGFGQMQDQFAKLRVQHLQSNSQIKASFQDIMDRNLDVLKQPTSLQPPNNILAQYRSLCRVIAQKPELQRSLRDEINSVPSTDTYRSWVVQSQRSHATRAALRAVNRCRCNIRRDVNHRNSPAWSPFAWFRSGEHDFDCPLYESEANNFMPGNFLKLMNKVVVASLGNPLMNHRPVVSSQSPQFSLFKPPSRLLPSDPWHETGPMTLQAINWLDLVCEQIEQMFWDGPASPFDVDEDGRTLLMVRYSEHKKILASWHR